MRVCFVKMSAGALSLAGLSFLVTGCLQAETIYTYSANYGSYAVPIAFVTSLSGSQLDNLPGNTNISASILAFSMLGVPAPPQDAAGFPLGVSGFQAPDTVLIGTNAAGNITSFDVTGTLFASYPAIPNENPNDFFCNYAESVTSTSVSGSLALDHDSGFCPGAPTTMTGSGGFWSSTSVAGGNSAYIYTDDYGSVPVAMGFATTLLGAQFENLPANTNIQASLGGVALTSGIHAPATDTAGFPLGISDYQGPQQVAVGTDAAGNITSFNLSGTLFASYPAIPNENPNDFFCDYQVTVVPGSVSSALSTDHDSGFCPALNSNTLGISGKWSSVLAVPVTTPEPGTWLLAACALLVLILSRSRARHRTTPAHSGRPRL